MRTLALALCLLPAFVLADDPGPKVLAVTNAYAREMADLEKKYTAAVERMKGVLIAEERKRRDATIASLQALQDEATKKQSLDLAVSAKNEGEMLKSLSYLAEVKTVPSKYFGEKPITQAHLGTQGRLFFTPASIDEKPVEWVNKIIYFDRDGRIYDRTPNFVGLPIDIGFSRITKKGELEWLNEDQKVIGSFTFAHTASGLYGFGSFGVDRHILHMETK